MPTGSLSRAHSTGTVAEEEIRHVLDRWVSATRARDIDAILATCTTDVLGFDCHGQLQLGGADAYRRHLEACLPGMQGSMRFEVHELAIVAESDVGFCHYLALCGGTGPDGEEHASWFRGTNCFRRTGGRWKIAHAHFSVPFDPASGRPLLEIEPESVPAT